MTTLLPCPFDGGEAKLSYPEHDYTSWAVVTCTSCGVRGKRIPFHTYYNCEGAREWYGREAAAAWNRRVPTEAKQ